MRFSVVTTALRIRCSRFAPFSALAGYDDGGQGEHSLPARTAPIPEHTAPAGCGSAYVSQRLKSSQPAPILWGKLVACGRVALGLSTRVHRLPTRACAAPVPCCFVGQVVNLRRVVNPPIDACTTSAQRRMPAAMVTPSPLRLRCLCGTGWQPLGADFAERTNPIAACPAPAQRWPPAATVTPHLLRLGCSLWRGI
jgi:hypothetical protein